MARARIFPTLITFAAAAIILAVAIAFLPQGKSNPDQTGLPTSYGNSKNEPTAAPGQESVFDFLQFQTGSSQTEPSDFIFGLGKDNQAEQSATIKGSSLTRSPAESVVVVENSDTMQKIDVAIGQDKVIREKAIRSGELDDCGKLNNERDETDCRGEIYFQKAIAGKDASLCEKIVGEDLKKRCQNYLNLILSNAQ